MQDRWLADPYCYATIDYGQDFDHEFQVDVRLEIRNSGHLNAVSLLTNNFLAFVLTEGRGVQWLMNQLILPLPDPMDVQAGDTIAFQFRYAAGCSLEELQQTINAERCSHAMNHSEGTIIQTRAA